MQILKDEIRNRIEESARLLFLKKGFEGVSMREIAKYAGESKSNLYNYFSSKEEIFESMVKMFYSQLEGFLDIFIGHEFNEEFGSEAFINLLSESVYKYLLSGKEDLLLIMNCSKGTKYEKVKEEVTGRLADHFKKEVLKPEDSDDFYIMNVLAANLIEGVLNISLNRKDEKIIMEDLKLLMKYHVNGMRSIL